MQRERAAEAAEVERRVDEREERELESFAGMMAHDARGYAEIGDDDYYYNGFDDDG